MLLFYLLLIFLPLFNSSKISEVIESDLKGLTPFFLQDPSDSLCLGLTGFTICDEQSLWILSRNKNTNKFSLINLFANDYKKLCLGYSKKYFSFGKNNSIQTVPSKYSSETSNSWEWIFVSDNLVKLSINNLCLVRGQINDNKNSISLAPCNQNNNSIFSYHPTYLHEQGFLLKSVDGSCFDGSLFTNCYLENQNLDESLLWGVGLKFIKNELHRYFFKFLPALRNQCLSVVNSNKFNLTRCDKTLPFVNETYSCISDDTCQNNQIDTVSEFDSYPPLYHWSLTNGVFIANGKCLIRLNNNHASLDKCSNGGLEYLQIDLFRK